MIIDYAFTGQVYETENLAMFPEGISGTFRLFKVTETGEKELVYLIDNHAPYSFHEHDKLPNDHDSRVTIHVKSWQGSLG